ncbi:hypothetical protein NMG60_11003791 [Bertholletia excelsa]
MGRPDPDQIIKHFSHQHPLKLLNLQSQSTQGATCSCCELDASGWLYHCNTCNYYLHRTCSSLSQTLQHAVDKEHDLILLSSPPYPEGIFRCNACGGHGSGFCYNCKLCHLDLHTTCAVTPESIEHSAHEHTLNLCFSPPYDKKSFQCDICQEFGSDHWLYRCNLCEFDAHVKCANDTQPQPMASRVSSGGLNPEIGVPNWINQPNHDNFSASWMQTNPVPMVTYTPPPNGRYAYQPTQNAGSQRKNKMMKKAIGCAVQGVVGAACCSIL